MNSDFVHFFKVKILSGIKATFTKILPNFQEADIGMGFFSVIEERTQVVNFTNYLGYDTYTILMKNIQRVSKVEGFTAPFTRKVSASLRPKPGFKLIPETILKPRMAITLGL